MRKNRASATACLIATAQGVCGDDPAFARFVSAEAKQFAVPVMQCYGAPASWFAGCLSWPRFRKLVYFLEKQMLPGILMHYLLRKCFLEHAAREAISLGARQVVVLGAGFDTLGWRLTRMFPALRCLEVDHASTQAVKLLAFESLGVEAEKIDYVCGDLAQEPFEEVIRRLKKPGPLQKPFFMAEGVLMYLPESRVRPLISSLHRFSSPGSRFAFTFMNPLPNGKIDFEKANRRVQAWMKFRKEPFLWGIAPAKLQQWLQISGFKLLEIVGASDLRNRFLQGSPLEQQPLAVGEWIAVAERR